MTEPSPSDLPRSKPSTLASEAQKKKKNSRKKFDVKSHNNHAEQHIETKPQDNKLDGYADVINYINRLEHDVALAKKQLKNQRQNFRKAISALAQHFDSQGISSDVISNYINSLGKREAQVESLQESYEKFYSEHKYQIVQDPKNLAPKAQPKPKRKSSIEPPHEAHNLTENNQGHSPHKEIVEPEHQHQHADKKKKKSTKEKVTNGEAHNGEEAPKKRKYQKKPKHTEEEEDKKAEQSPLEIQEIPSSAKNSAKKSAPRNEESLRSYEEIPQLKQADMKENKQYGDMRGYFNQLGMDPMSMMSMYMPGLNMGMPMGNLGIGNMDGEYYNKIMQELMKSNVMQNMQNMMNMDQSRQDVFNHYQRNLK